jgi:ornithine cyclodeaminase
MLLLTERDVKAVLPMADLIDAMEQALRQYSTGRVVQPVRTVLEVGPERGYFGVMPAALDDPPAAGAKLVTVYHRNHERGLPSHLATIVLNDHGTGKVLAVLDGRYITEARTGAVSAVSVRHLARPDASVLAVIGTGVQAQSHVQAIGLVRRLAKIRVWSPNDAHRDAFARDLEASLERAGSETRVRATRDAREAVSGADVIVLATSSTTPVIESADVMDGAHICAVGACRPDQREMPTALVARARVFVDSRAAALQEAGDLLIPIRAGAITEHHIAGELGEVVTGAVKGRRAPADVTIFKSLGMAAEDVVAARLAVERAKAAGKGQTFSFD